MRQFAPVLLSGNLYLSSVCVGPMHCVAIDLRACIGDTGTGSSLVLPHLRMLQMVTDSLRR